MPAKPRTARRRAGFQMLCMAGAFAHQDMEVASAQMPRSMTPATKEGRDDHFRRPGGAAQWYGLRRVR